MRRVQLVAYATISNRKINTPTQKVRRERLIWESLDHPNILPFYGHADDAMFEPFGAFISPVVQLVSIAELF